MKTIIFQFLLLIFFSFLTIGALNAQICNDPNAHNFGEVGPCETCFDMVQNGDETGVDCGGTNPSCAECPTVYNLDVEGNAIIQDGMFHVTNAGSSNGTQDGNINFGDIEGSHLTFDNSEIQAKNGTGFNTFYMNHWGGNINCGNGDLYINNSTGSIGIGTTLPNSFYKLDVVGNKLRLRNTSGSKYIEMKTDGGAVDLVSVGSNLHFFANGGNDIIMQENFAGAGNVGIGTASPSAKLHVAGSLKVNTMFFGDERNVQWDDGTKQFGYDNSSLRYKSDVKKLKIDFKSILKAEPMTYTRPRKPNKWEIGFAAEQFHELGLEPLVEYMDGLPDGIRYDKVVVFLIPIIKSQEEKIEQQEERIEQQQTQIDDLQKMLESLLADRSSSTHSEQENNNSTTRPKEELLLQNQPNPFSAQTTIAYHIPKTTTRAKIHITDLSGKILKTYPLKGTGTGNIKVQGNTFAAGIYMYSLELDGALVATKKMVLTK